MAAGSGTPGNGMDMVNYAKHIWSMLDTLSEDDPQSYRKFINKQLMEGRQSTSLPQPHMCVKTAIIVSDSFVMFKY
jgi:hypothetical protein